MSTLPVLMKYENELISLRGTVAELEQACHRMQGQQLEFISEIASRKTSEEKCKTLIDKLTKAIRDIEPLVDPNMHLGAAVEAREGIRRIIRTALCNSEIHVKVVVPSEKLELEAQVIRLQEVLRSVGDQRYAPVHVESMISSVLSATPAQCLAEHDAEKDKEIASLKGKIVELEESIEDFELESEARADVVNQVTEGIRGWLDGEIEKVKKLRHAKPSGK